MNNPELVEKMFTSKVEEPMKDATEFASTEEYFKYLDSPKKYVAAHPTGDTEVSLQKFMEVDPDFDLSNVVQCLRNLQSLGVTLTNTELLDLDIEKGKAL